MKNDGNIWKNHGKILMETYWMENLMNDENDERLDGTLIYNCHLLLEFYSLTSRKSSLNIGNWFKQDEFRTSLLSLALALGCFGGISDSFCSFQLLGIRIFQAKLNSD